MDRDGDFNFTLLMFGVSALGAFALVNNVARGWSITSSVIAAVMAVAYLVGGIFVVREHRREDAFRQWLFSHAHAIWAEGVEYQGVLVRPDTELVTFPIGVSMLILRFSQPSCPELAEGPYATRARLGTVLTTGTAGWWSLFGVLATPMELFVAARGGARITVNEYMEQLAKDGVTSRWRQRGDLH
ncbi:MAG: hypothetical protein IPK74_23945 [Deltaproteobacteria bacterium]|nr:hypothetical protein [Deltaproteobacteria bacterium]